MPSIDPTEWATLVQQFNTALGPPGAGFEFGGWKSGCSVLSFVAFVACIPTFYQWSLDDFCGNCVIFSITFGGLFVVASESLPSYGQAAAPPSPRTFVHGCAPDAHIAAHMDAQGMPQPCLNFNSRLLPLPLVTHPCCPLLVLAILIISSYAYAAAKAQRNQAYARWNNAIQSWNQVHRGTFLLCCTYARRQVGIGAGSRCSQYSHRASVCHVPL